MGKVVGSILGMDSGNKAGAEAARAGERFAKDVYFRPYTMTTGTGANRYTPDTYEARLNQPFYNAQAGSLATSSNVFNQLQNQSIADRSSQIFKEQAALLDPEFKRQATELQGTLFGTGRLGLRLAGEGVGAAGAGGIQPDAFGLAQAQQQTLGALAAGSRQQASDEYTALADVGLKALAGSLGVSELELQLMRAGLDAESARAMAAASAGQVGTSGYQAKVQAGMASDQAMGSLWGGVFGGLLGKD